MNTTKTMGEGERRIWQGRMVYAFVMARAKECPRSQCRRKGCCLARFGQPGSNYYTPTGDCWNMSEAEWRVVGLAMHTNILKIGPGASRRVEAKQRAQWPKLSFARQQRCYSLPEEVAKRAEEERRRESRGGVPFCQMLWLTEEGDDVLLPPDIDLAGELLIRVMAARGCQCASERRLVCDRNRYGEVVIARGCEDAITDVEAFASVTREAARAPITKREDVPAG